MYLIHNRTPPQLQFCHAATIHHNNICSTEKTEHDAACRSEKGKTKLKWIVVRPFFSIYQLCTRNTLNALDLINFVETGQGRFNASSLFHALTLFFNNKLDVPHLQITRSSCNGFYNFPIAGNEFHFVSTDCVIFQKKGKR